MRAQLPADCHEKTRQFDWLIVMHIHTLLGGKEEKTALDIW